MFFSKSENFENFIRRSNIFSIIKKISKTVVEKFFVSTNSLKIHNCKNYRSNKLKIRTNFTNLLLWFM